MRKNQIERFIGVLVATLLVAGHAAAQEQLGSGFSYQGRLTKTGDPLNDTADFEFTLWDADTAGNMIGAKVAVDNVAIKDGLFTVAINFGLPAFNGEKRWLEIAVRSPAGGGAFTRLSPRQPLTATPYALYALDGPGGKGGFWAANGDDIHNTNSRNVGIGTTTPLDELHVRGDIATLRLDDVADPNSFSLIEDLGSRQLRISKISPDAALVDLDPQPADGFSSAEIRLFRQTDTTGLKGVHFYRGNNTT